VKFLVTGLTITTHSQCSYRAVGDIQR
jgi:hypothetical protein